MAESRLYGRQCEVQSAYGTKQPVPSAHPRRTKPALSLSSNISRPQSAMRRAIQMAAEPPYSPGNAFRPHETINKTCHNPCQKQRQQQMAEQMAAEPPYSPGNDFRPHQTINQTCGDPCQKQHQENAFEGPVNLIRKLKGQVEELQEEMAAEPAHATRCGDVERVTQALADYRTGQPVLTSTGPQQSPMTSTTQPPASNSSRPHSANRRAKQMAAESPYNQGNDFRPHQTINETCRNPCQNQRQQQMAAEPAHATQRVDASSINQALAVYRAGQPVLTAGLIAGLQQSTPTSTQPLSSNSSRPQSANRQTLQMPTSQLLSPASARPLRPLSAGTSHTMSLKKRTLQMSSQDPSSPTSARPPPSSEFQESTSAAPSSPGSVRPTTPTEPQALILARLMSSPQCSSKRTSKRIDKRIWKQSATRTCQQYYSTEKVSDAVGRQLPWEENQRSLARPELPDCDLSMDLASLQSMLPSDVAQKMREFVASLHTRVAVFVEMEWSTSPWLPGHDESNYRKHFDILRTSLAQQVGVDMLVEQMPIKLSGAPLHDSCTDNGNGVALNQSFELATPTRAGAFEVVLITNVPEIASHKCVLVHSKLWSRRWPSLSNLVCRCQMLLAQELEWLKRVDDTVRGA